MDFASSSLFTADFAYENELDLSSLITPSTFIPFQEPNPSIPTIHCAGAENDGRQRIRETTTTDEITNEDVEPKNKKAKRREIERQRRQEVTSLFKNLRYILPSQYIKGKRSSSDHVQEAVNYIKDLEKKIKEISEKRDRIKRSISHSSSTGECSIRSLESSYCSCDGYTHIDVKVRTCLVGIEIVASCCFTQESCLSSILQLLIQEQCLDVVSCISSRLHPRFIHTIVCERQCTQSTVPSKSMAEESPLVLVHRPPTMKYMDEPLTRYYRILTTHTSSDPLPVFLSRHASSVRAVVSIGRFKIDADFLSRLPSLQLIVCTSVGTDHVDLPECNRRGIAVTNAGGAYSEDVADYAVGLLISFLRRIPAADRYVRSGKWARCGEFQLGIKLSGKRIGILGLGSIGSLIAKRLEPFGCIISYNSTRQKQSIPYLYYPDVVSLAANNDVIVLCCALNDQTRHIVNREVMEALGKKGIIINVGRGGLIDEKEMVKCLVEGVIGGAGLDAFEKEPGVPVELFGLDNVVLSPHCAIATPGSFDNVVELALANLKAFFSNQPLISPVRLN
ncbi:unnamed protein product [Brassica napus]|uniref:(rape) hypothetical protein n=1 Tax=Brassica napus TaxID=3708 RepID=A0A816UX17_BRANA|nr:unnamed protein product [Brassica napus]